VADQSASGLPGRPRVDTIPFNEDELQAVLLDNREVVLPVRAVCGVLGLDADTQAENLRQHDVLAQGLRYVRIPTGGGIQTVLALHRRYLYLWLASIPPNQVRPEIRPKLKAYQEELVELLNAIYGVEPEPGSLEPAAPPSVTPATVALIARQMRTLAAQLREEWADSQDAQNQEIAELKDLVNTHLGAVQGQLDEAQQRLLDYVKITAAQQSVIRRAIEGIGKRYEKKTGKRIYDLLYARFRTELGTPRYDALPAAKYAKALDWLRDRAREYLPDDPDALPPLQESLL